MSVPLFAVSKSDGKKYQVKFGSDWEKSFPVPAGVVTSTPKGDPAKQPLLSVVAGNLFA